MVYIHIYSEDWTYGPKTRICDILIHQKLKMGKGKHKIREIL